MINKNSNYKLIYLLILSFIIIISVGLISLLLAPYENILSQLNKLRPESPFQFFTQEYHSIVNKVIGILTFCFLFMSILLIKRKQQCLNLVCKIYDEMFYYHLRLKEKTSLFFKTNSNLYIGSLFVFILLGICLRIFYIDRPVFHDEAKTFYSFISSSWMDAISNYYIPNNHVFHSICARIFYLLFGNEEWVFRIPVLLSGIFTVAFIYFYARQYYNKHISLILSAVITNSIPLVFYSVNARGYIMGTLFFLCLSILIKSIRDKESIILWFLFILITTLSVWTVPTMIMSVIFLFIWYILNSNTSQLLYDIIKLSLIGLVCIASSFIVYSPVILRSSIHSIFSNQYVQSQTLSEIVQKFPNYIYELWLFVTSGYSNTIQLYMVLFFLILGIYYHLVDKNHRKIIYSTILLFIVVLFIMRKLPYTRTLLFMYPVIWGVIVSGIYMMISTISNYLKININKSVYIVSMFLLIYSSLNCLTYEGIIEQSKDQTCPQAEEIITEIKMELGPNDIIETSTPLAGPIRYYLIKNGINQNQFYWYSSNKSKENLLNYNTIYVITRGSRNSLASFGYTEMSSIEKHDPPILWKKYEDGVNVYIITKSS